MYTPPCLAWHPTNYRATISSDTSLQELEQRHHTSQWKSFLQRKRLRCVALAYSDRPVCLPLLCINSVLVVNEHNFPRTLYYYRWRAQLNPACVTGASNPACVTGASNLDSLPFFLPCAGFNNGYGCPMQTTSCTWPYVVPIGEDAAAHGHWCAFTDLYHTMGVLPSTQPVATLGSSFILSSFDVACACCVPFGWRC